MLPQQLTLIRHAQGFHNLDMEGHQFHDPRLTQDGQQQCRNLAQELEGIQTIDCIIASPLLRTLHTALLVFEDLLRSKPDLRIIALPELQETSDLPCDIGSSAGELEEEFRDKPVDLSLVTDDWTNKVTGVYTPNSDLIAARCRKARHYLASLLDKKRIAVVAHGAILHYLTDDWYGATTGIGTGWENCEARIYHFDTSTDSSVVDAAIVETEESQRNRTSLAYPFSKLQQLRMKEKAEASWAADGYIVLSNKKAKASTPTTSPTHGAKPTSKQKLRVKVYRPQCCIL